jgi:hypothetical protein
MIRLWRQQGRFRALRHSGGSASPKTMGHASPKTMLQPARSPAAEQPTGAGAASRPPINGPEGGPSRLPTR